MRLPRPKPSSRLRHEPKRHAPATAAAPARADADPAAIDTTAMPARDPDDEHAPSPAPEAGFRASSYDLKHGLDVVELPTSLPAEVLERLFKSSPR